MKKTSLLFLLLAPILAHAADVVEAPKSSSVNSMPTSPFKDTSKETLNLQKKELQDLDGAKALIEAKTKIREEEAKRLEAEAKYLLAKSQLKALNEKLNPPPAPKQQPLPKPKEPPYQALQIDAYAGDPQPPNLMGVVTVGQQKFATVNYLGSNYRVTEGTILGGRTISQITQTSLKWGEKPVWSSQGLQGTVVKLTDMDAERELKLFEMTENLRKRKEGATNVAMNVQSVAPLATYTPSATPATSNNGVRKGLPPEPPKL